ncbi:unnamed protein product [Sphagnum balticum]
MRMCAWRVINSYFLKWKLNSLVSEVKPSRYQVAEEVKMKMSKKMSRDQRIATSALMELSARPTVLAIESGPQRRAPKAQALAAAPNTVAPAAAASGNVVKTKYRHIHFYKDSGKFGTWSRPYKGCPQKRVYIGSFRSMYLSKRAQDRAYLKYKLDTNIQLHFKESDYALDEELRNTMSDLDFVKLLRAESRDYYKLAAEPSKCLQSYYKPPSEDEETQALVGSFSKRTPEAKASSSTAIEEPAKVSRPKRRAKTLCSEVIRKVCSKKPRSSEVIQKVCSKKPMGAKKVCYQVRSKVCSKKPQGAKTRCSKVHRKVWSKQLKRPSEHEIRLGIEASLKSVEIEPPSLAPDAVEDMFLDHVSIVRKQRSPRKSAFWKTINARSTTTAGAEGSHAVATAVASEILSAILSAIPISECERSDVMQLDNSLDMEKDQEQQLEQQLEVNMSIPTTPLKSRFDLMDQITFPSKKRTTFRRRFA